MNIISSFSKSALDAHSLSTTSFSSTTSVIDATAVTSSTSFSDGSNSGSSRNTSELVIVVVLFDQIISSPSFSLMLSVSI